MAVVAKLSGAGVVLYGVFPDSTRQTIPLDTVTDLPPGYSKTSNALVVPEGVYLYELLHAWSFTAEWSYHSGGQVIVNAEKAKVVEFTSSGSLYLRGIASAGSLALIRVTKLE